MKLSQWYATIITMKQRKVLFDKGMSGVGNLLKASAQRLSDRFVDYSKIYIATILLFAVFISVFAGISLAFFGIAQSLHFNLLYVLVIPLLVAFFCGLIYLSTWCGLVTIDALIGTPGLSIKKRFNSIRPIVIGYFWFNAFFGLFMFGLIPFGLISLGIVFIYWAVVSSFTAFIYLEHKPLGLTSLWASRQMMKREFWRILFLFIIVYGVVFSIDIILLRSDHPITRITSWMLNFVSAPFFIALRYQVYKNIPYPTKIEVPRGWIIASRVGIILTIIGLIIIIKTAVQAYPMLNEMPINIPSQLAPDKII